MRIKKRVLRKMFSFFASVLLLVNSFSPFLLIAPSFSQVKAQTETVTPTTEPTPTVEVTPTETPAPAPTAEPTLVPIETTTPTPTVEMAPTETPAPTSEPTVTQEPTPIQTPLQWTFENVELNKEYIAPQNSEVKLTFTKLPDPAGNIRIEEITLTDDQIKQTESLSNKAYDITSDMKDGDFSYNLSLPIPELSKGKSVEVKFAEELSSISAAEKIENTLTKTDTSVSVASLNHFTIFIVANPSTGADGSGVGTVSWSGLGNIYTANGVFATSSPGASARTHYLKGTNYGLSIPSTANIEGILVKIKRKAATASRIKDSNIKIIKGGVVKTTNKANTSTFWPITNTYASYGGATDLWGETWTPADVNASNFGVAVSAVRNATGSTVVASVDHIEVTVYYNNPPIISVSSPNGSELFAGNSSQTISWSASDPDSSDTLSVTLEYTTDIGVTYNLIASDLTNSGTYNWTVPAIDSTTAQIRTTVSDGSLSSSDLSDASFTIDSTPPSLISQTVFSGWHNTDQTSDFTYTDDNGIVSGTPVSCVISTEGLSQTCIVDPVNVCENAGNCNTTPVTSKAADIDKTNPMDPGTPTADFSSPTNQTFITWSWSTATDTISDVKQYFWNLYQDVDTWLDGGNTTNVQLSTDVSGYGDGNFSFDVQPEDNAGNIGNVILSSATTVDTVPPTVVSQETQDLNGNGNIDAIKLTFSEDINDSQLNVGASDGWDVDGAGDESIDTGDVDDDNILLLGFGEGTTPDSGNTPMISYTPTGGPTSTHDTAGNELALLSTVTSDGALPVVLSAETQDINSNGKIDTIKLTFSEKIDDRQLNPGNADGWDVDAYDGELIRTGSVENDNILTLSFNEGTSYDVNLTPTVMYFRSLETRSTHDLAGNQLNDYSASSTDKSAPTAPSANPIGDDYLADQTVTLSGESGAEIRYTADGTEPTVSTGAIYTNPILIGIDTVLKAIAIDSVGNVSTVMTETYGIAPVISSEASTSVGTTSTTITWTTDDPSTSRVVYDTVSHTLGTAPNYGYANSTIEDSTKVTSHAVGITGLTSGTTYYYRTISHGSPEAVSAENSFKTDTPNSGGSGGGTVAGASAPVCSDQKPGNSPVLLSAIAGVNSVTLTWSKASDPVSYYLMTFGTSPGAQTYGNPNIGGKDTATYTVSGLSGGATYYFKIRAGNGCMPGDFSNEASATPSGGFIAGVPAGFEAGVLGEATKSAELTEEPTPTTTVINAGLVKGIESIAKNKFSKYIFPIILLILLVSIAFYLYKKRNS